ncbi:MAG: mandelate racemase/muconate lactonizing enzyme family protein, partial [Chloroflexi bacterium]|nr:mandelate racemase/muconate lactonizing enzyme family protein [Chloroflexota bacterium]
AGMAEANYVQMAPHLYTGPIEAAANIQVATCSPNFLIQESIQNFTGFFADVLKKPIQWEDGYIIPPTDPGIGYELDEAVVEANLYEGDGVFPPMGPRD